MVITDKELCTGCGNCADICPGDLLALDPRTNTSYIRRAEDCWDCMACVKSCSSGALRTKLPYQLASFGASLAPEVFPDRIVWTSRDAAGREEKFTVKTLEA
ncbi:MAG: 4Fe-4S binding protein [Actinobacteria bacterium]|nr:4Fe-4S binding protein [Actinomycetota bacterium]